MFKRVSHRGCNSDFRIGQSSVEIKQYIFFIHFLFKEQGRQ